MLVGSLLNKKKKKTAKMHLNEKVLGKKKNLLGEESAEHHGPNGQLHGRVESQQANSEVSSLLG